MTTTELDFDRTKIRDIDLWDPAIKADPAETFLRWSMQDPFYIMHGGAPQAVFTRFSDARLVLENVNLFSARKRPWPGMEKYYYWRGLPVVTDNDPPVHTKLRRLLSPAFSPRRLAAVEDGVRRFVAERLDAIAAKGEGTPFDLMEDFAKPLSVHMILGLLLDIPPEERDQLIGVSYGLSLFAALPAGSPPPPEYVGPWDESRAYCERLIEQRRRQPQDDLVSNIIAAHDDEGRLTTDELFATFIILFTAGLTGSAHLIGWLVWRLCSTAGQLALLRDRPELIANAIEETLRIEPIAFTSLRWTEAEFELSGLRCLPDMPVMVIPGVAGFDPERYEDPLRFDITRTPRRDNLAFGFGIHHCIGAPVARLAARHAVTSLIDRFPRLRLQQPEVRPPVSGSPKDRGPSSIPMFT